MEIQKYRPINAHILGHAKVEKLPEKQDLSKSAKRTYNVTMPQPILVNIQIESKNKHSKPLSAIKEGTLKCHMNASCQVLSLMPKIQLEVKWKGPIWFIPTGQICGAAICHSILTNQYITLLLFSRFHLCRVNSEME